MMIFIIFGLVFGYIASRLTKQGYLVFAWVCVGLIIAFAISVSCSLSLSSTQLGREYDARDIELVNPSESVVNGHCEFYYLNRDGSKSYSTLHAQEVSVFREDRQKAYIAKVETEEVVSEKVMFWLVPKVILLKNINKRYALHIPRA